MKNGRSDFLNSKHFKNLVWGAEHGAFEAETERTIFEIERMGAGDETSRKLIEDFVIPLRVRDAYGELPPFRVPRMPRTHGAIRLGRSLARASVWMAATVLTAGLLVAGNTGAAKSNTFKRMALRLATLVKGLWFAEMYKTDVRHLRAAFRRRGRDLIVLGARRGKFNFLQADGDPHGHAALGVDVLCRGVDMPPLAGIILREAWHVLYQRYGIYRGKTDEWPTLYDLYEEIRTAKNLNAPARGALLDRLASLLRSLTPQVAAYRLAWRPSDLTQHFIAFEFKEAPEHVKSVLINYLLFSVLQKRIDEGRSNVPLDFSCFFDDTQRFTQIGSGAGSGITPLTELAGLIRATGTGLAFACQSMEGVPAGLRANLATKCMCRLGAHSDWQILGADMGMTAEQVRWAQQHLRPGLAIWQLADSPWRYPFVVKTPKLKGAQFVSDLEAAETTRALDHLPVKPAEEFLHWQPVPVINISVQEHGDAITKEERRFLQAVIQQPRVASSAYAAIVGMSGKTAVRIRRQLVQRGYLRECSVAIQTRGTRSHPIGTFGAGPQSVCRWKGCLVGRGFEHDRILLDPIEAILRSRGLDPQREFPVDRNRGAGVVDLFLEYEGIRLAIEAERSADRVLNDVAKARRLCATVLLIVTPNARISQAARRKLHKAGVRRNTKELAILVQPLALAIAALANCFSIPTSRSSIRLEIQKSTEEATATSPRIKETEP